MTTLEELTRAIDLGRDEEIQHLMIVLMMNIRQQDDADAQAEFERGLDLCLRAHKLASHSIRKLMP